MSENRIVYAALSQPDPENPDLNELIIQRVIMSPNANWDECERAAQERWPMARFIGWYSTHIAFSNGENDIKLESRKR